MLPRIGIAAAVLAFVVGCASGRSAPTPGSAPGVLAPTVSSIVGDYALVAVDGHALPFAPRSRTRDVGKSPWPVVSGSLALHSDGTFHMETRYDTGAEGGQSAFQFSGTCYTAESEVRMVWDGGGLTALTRRGDTLVLNNDGTLYSYLRR